MKKLLTAVILLLVTSFLFSAELKMFYPGTSKEYIETKFEDTCDMFQISSDMYSYGPWGSLSLYGYDIFRIIVKYDELDKVKYIQISLEQGYHENYDTAILGLLLDEEITVEERLTREIKGKSKKGYKYNITTTDSVLIISINK